MSKFHAVRDFLFRNQRWGQALAKNLIWLGLGQGTVRLVRMAVILLVVRVLGPEEYGRFALAYSFVTLFTGVLEGGVLTVAAKEFAADPSNEKLLPDVLAIKVITNLIAAAVVLPGMFWMTSDPTVKRCIIVLLAQQFVLEVGSGIYAATRAKGKMEYETALSLLQNLLLLASTVLTLRLSSSAFIVSGGQFVSAVVWFLVLCLAVWRSGYRIKPAIHWSTIVHLARQCMPLLLGGIAATVYVNIDSVILGKTGNLTQVGWYNAAVKVVQGILLLPIALANIAVVPAFASLLGSDHQNLAQRWDKWRTLLVLSGGYMAALLFAAAQPLILKAFGPHFLPTVPVVRVMAVSIALMYVYTPYSQALIIYGKQGVLFVCQAIAALVSVFGNLLVIPRFGMNGAAWMTIATHGTLLLLLAVLTPRRAPVPSPGKQYRVVLIGCTLAGIVIVASGVLGISPWVGCALATCIFGVLGATVIRPSSFVLRAAVGNG